MRHGLTLLAIVPVALLSACGKPAPEPSAPPTTDAASDATATTTAPAALPANLSPEQVAAAGQAVFRRCVACHTADKGGANGIGPNLWGVAGRKVASVPGFAYSPAMQELGGTWDDATLDAYLAKPQAKVQGTRMAFAGIPDPADRAALIAWLKTRRD